MECAYGYLSTVIAKYRGTDGCANSGPPLDGRVAYSQSLYSHWPM